jgi:hypothetical protein
VEGGTLSRPKALLVVAVIALAPTIGGHLFLWQMERRLDLKILKKPVFMLWPGRLTLKEVKFEWKDKITVTSGTLSLKYPLTAIFRVRYPFFLAGRNLSVQAGPIFRPALGSGQVLFDDVRAELIVDPVRGLDINSLDAESKTIQFHLKGRG